MAEDRQDELARRERHASELEANQQQLRESIAHSKQLVDEADAIIRRHRAEAELAEGGGAPAQAEPPGEDPLSPER